MSLTAVAIRNAKPLAAPYKLADGNGLYLLVQPTGARLWRFDYRFSGKRKTLALGVFPSVSLADARLTHEQARSLLRSGTDPTVVRKEAKRQPEKVQSRAFTSVAMQWFDARKGAWVEGYARRVWSRVEADLSAEFGDKDVDDIDRSDVLTALRKIEDRGAIVLAKRVRAYCAEIYRYARADGLTDKDPTADLLPALRTSPPTKHRAAIPAMQLPTLLQRLDTYDGLQTKLALRLALLTFVRTSELRFAHRDEFENLDGVEPLWRIPPARMKMREEHLVPLAPQAVGLVKRLFAIEPKSRLLLSAKTVSGVISENTLIYALYRLGYHSVATVHGFRSLASTVLNEAQFNPDWIERQLAHVEPNQVRAAYNAAQWLQGRREMMHWWADYLDRAITRAEPITAST